MTIEQVRAGITRLSTQGNGKKTLQWRGVELVGYNAPPLDFCPQAHGQGCTVAWICGADLIALSGGAPDSACVRHYKLRAPREFATALWRAGRGQDEQGQPIFAPDGRLVFVSQHVIPALTAVAGLYSAYQTPDPSNVGHFMTRNEMKQSESPYQGKAITGIDGKTAMTTFEEGHHGILQALGDPEPFTMDLGTQAEPVDREWIVTFLKNSQTHFNMVWSPAVLKAGGVLGEQKMAEQEIDLTGVMLDPNTQIARDREAANPEPGAPPDAFARAKQSAGTIMTDWEESVMQTVRYWGKRGSFKVAKVARMLREVCATAAGGNGYVGMASTVATALAGAGEAGLYFTGSYLSEERKDQQELALAQLEFLSGGVSLGQCVQSQIAAYMSVPSGGHRVVEVKHWAECLPHLNYMKFTNGTLVLTDQMCTAFRLEHRELGAEPMLQAYKTQVEEYKNRTQAALEALPPFLQAFVGGRTVPLQFRDALKALEKEPERVRLIGSIGEELDRYYAVSAHARAFEGQHMCILDYFKNLAAVGDTAEKEARVANYVWEHVAASLARSDPHTHLTQKAPSIVQRGEERYTKGAVEKLVSAVLRSPTRTLQQPRAKIMNALRELKNHRKDARGQVDSRSEEFQAVLTPIFDALNVPTFDRQLNAETLFEALWETAMAPEGGETIEGPGYLSMFGFLNLETSGEPSLQCLIAVGLQSFLWSLHTWLARERKKQLKEIPEVLQKQEHIYRILRNVLAHHRMPELEKQMEKASACLRSLAKLKERDFQDILRNRETGKAMVTHYYEGCQALQALVDTTLFFKTLAEMSTNCETVVKRERERITGINAQMNAWSATAAAIVGQFVEPAGVLNLLQSGGHWASIVQGAVYFNSGRAPGEIVGFFGFLYLLWCHKRMVTNIVMDSKAFGLRIMRFQFRILGAVTAAQAGIVGDVAEIVGSSGGVRGKAKAAYDAIGGRHTYSPDRGDADERVIVGQYEKVFENIRKTLSCGLGHLDAVDKEDIVKRLEDMQRAYALLFENPVVMDRCIRLQKEYAGEIVRDFRAEFLSPNTVHPVVGALEKVTEDVGKQASEGVSSAEARSIQREAVAQLKQQCQKLKGTLANLWSSQNLRAVETAANDLEAGGPRRGAPAPSPSSSSVLGAS